MLSRVSTALSTFQSTYNSLLQKLDTIECLCDIIPPIPSLSFLVVNLWFYVLMAVSVVVRFPVCLLLGSLQSFECPQCVLYNLFPFLSILNLFVPASNNCLLFGCACPSTATGCYGVTGTNVSTSGILSFFYCNGKPCPQSYLNYLFCILGYVFLAPFSPFIDFINFGLSIIFGKTITFSFNCPPPSDLPCYSS